MIGIDPSVLLRVIVADEPKQAEAARINATAGCDHTVTFDRKASKLPGFKLLPSR